MSSSSLVLKLGDGGPVGAVVTDRGVELKERRQTLGPLYTGNPHSINKNAIR